MLNSLGNRGIFYTLALLVPLSGAFATQVPALSFEQLTDTSETVVSGSVARSWSDWDTNRQFIWTHYEITVSGTHKGAAAKTVVVSEPGGIVGDRAMTIAGTLSYAPGENVVLFLQRMPNGLFRTTGWSQGKYVVDPSGRVHSAGAGAGLEIMTPGTAASPAATPLRALDGMSAAAFRARIEARASSRQQGARQ